MDVNSKQRRRHSAEFKAQVLAACAEPGASVAVVALSFQLNDNLVHQWRRGRGASPASSAMSTTVAESAPQFIALSLPPLPPPSAPAIVAVAAVAAEEIRLEFKRGAIGVSVCDPSRRLQIAQHGFARCCVDPHRRAVAMHEASGHALRCRAAAFSQSRTCKFRANTL